jgi:hypothetical protein
MLTITVDPLVILLVGINIGMLLAILAFGRGMRNRPKMPKRPKAKRRLSKSRRRTNERLLLAPIHSILTYIQDRLASIL